MTLINNQIQFNPALNETIDLGGFASVSSTVTITPTGNYFFRPPTTLSSMSFDGTGYTMTLVAHLVATGTMSGPTSINANVYNVTADQIVWGGGGTVSMGTGTWTITGVNGFRGCSNISTLNAGSSTLLFKGATNRFGPGSKTFSNVTVDVGTDLQIESGEHATVNVLTLRAGSKIRATSSVITMSNLMADGTAARISIIGTGTFGMTKTGGGKIYADNLAINNCTGNPANTFHARNSSNGGSNTNWTFIPGNSRFMHFL